MLLLLLLRVAVSALTHQPLNLYLSPLDKGRFGREVQTCAPLSAVKNNLWLLPTGTNHSGPIKQADHCLSTGMVTVSGGGSVPPGSHKVAQVFSKLLHDGSTALLLLNRGESVANVSANLGRCLARGYGTGATFSALNLRDSAALPSIVLKGRNEDHYSQLLQPHDHMFLRLTPGAGASDAICQSSLSPYQFLRCPSGEKIQTVSFARYGDAPIGPCGGFKMADAACGADVTTLTIHCVGQAQCGVGAGLGPTALPESTCKRPQLFTTYECGV